MMADIIAYRYGTPQQVTRIFIGRSRPLSTEEEAGIPDDCTPEAWPGIAETLRGRGLVVMLDWGFQTEGQPIWTHGEKTY